MEINNLNIELIHWSDQPKNIKFLASFLYQQDNCINHYAVGMVAKEDEDIIKISSTIGTRGHLDIIEIKKQTIIKRTKLNLASES